MRNSIGQTIKRLRKERNLTQEELAELLNVTSQAVSKWENETGYPDISQIIPLASTFGVSTDVLFGTVDTTDDEEVMKVLKEVSDNKIFNLPPDEGRKIIKQNYDKLQEALKLYPNNCMLLLNSLEIGNSLAYREDNAYYGPEYADDIYHELIRQANILTAYDKNTNDVLRAHMIIALLHAQYGNINMAWEHANEFPWRADMTVHEISAFIANIQKDYSGEALHCERDIFYHLESMFDTITALGCAYLQLKQYGDALEVFKSVFTLIKIFFASEEYLPPLHCRERGDVHMLIAQTYLEINDKDNALTWIEKMADYDLNIRSKFKNDMMVKTPFLREVKYAYYNTYYDNKQKLSEKLNSSILDSVRDCERFKKLYADLSE